MRIAGRSGRRRTQITDPDSPDANTSTEEENNDCYNNPLKRKQHDSQKLQQQQKEMYKMAGFNKKLSAAIINQISKDREQFQKQTRTYATVSLCGCTVTNPFREKIIQIVVNPWFDKVILATIVANSIVLAAEDPAAEKNTFLETLDYIFLTIFSIEMLLKIIAMGFVMKPHSYLRDPWNILDFTVVILGWFTVFDLGGGSNVNSIRVVRILRPLRTINSVPGMRGLVMTLLNSLPQMLNILVLFSFTLIIFGTIGIQLFQGSFRGRCVLIDSISEANGFQEYEFLTNRDGNEMFCQTYKKPPYDCSEEPGYVCVDVGNPEDGLSHFDDIIVAIITAFEMITLEGWSGVMYQIRMSRGGFCLEGDIFCVGCVVFGALFVLNLMIAVQFNFLDEAFSEIEDKQKKQKADHAREMHDNNIEEIDKGIISPDQPGSAIDCNPNAEKPPSEEGKEDQNKAQKRCCCNCWYRFSDVMEIVVKSTAMMYVIIFLILANSAVMASEYHYQPEGLHVFQYWANVIFTVLFTVEMIISLIGLGVKGYVADGFNCFDGVVVILSLVELGGQIVTQSRDGGMFSILRGFRMLRIFKLVKSWTSLQKILATIITSLPAVANLAVLALLFIFIYALIGKQFFYGELIDPDSGELSRYHFNGFWRSLITMFIVLTGENWNWVMRIVIINRPDLYWTAVGYFVSAMLIGNFMLLNLFLAILLKYLQDSVIKEEEEKAQRLKQKQAEKELKELERQKAIQEGQQVESKKTSMKGFMTKSIMSAKTSNKDEFAETRKKLAKQKKEQLDEENEKIATAVINNKNLKKEKKEQLPNKHPELIKEQKEEEEQDNANQEDENQPEAFFAQMDLPPRGRQQTDYQSGLQTKTTRINKKVTKNEFELEGNSLYCFGPDNCLRVKVAEFVQNPYFEAFILHLIGINSLFMALEEPILTDPYSKATLKFFGDVVSVLFILECVLKIFVMGFVIGKKSYLRDSFNILDFVIVVISIVAWILEAQEGFDISFVRAFRALRALRPLKLVSKNEGMKLVVNAILNSIPSLINVGLISILFYFVFGVIGLQTLSGRVSACFNGDGDYMGINKALCDEDDSLEWVIPPNNYDNIFSSMLTFFEISTLEMWPDIMFHSFDSSEEIDGPLETDRRPHLAILYISFIFITTFFVMNLFISVIVRQFNEQKLKTEGSHGLTDEQKEWVKIQRFMAEVSPSVISVQPENKFRLAIYNFVNTNFFEWFITLIIVLNTVAMCMEFYGAPDDYMYVLTVANLVFVIIFTFEAVVKLLGLGPKYYFYIDWNKFDFAIVIVSLLSESPFMADVNLTAFRIIRVARLLRMIKASKQLQDLLRTLYLALNNIANVGILFMLIIFVFAVAGMDLFGEIKSGAIQGPDGGGIDANCNFNEFYFAVFVLIRAATGESWNAIMHDTNDETLILSLFFWLSFQLITFFIFMNVFIAVIYEEYANVNQVENTLEVLSLKKRDIQSFIDTWADVNIGGERYMKTDKFPQFMRDLPAPLGYKGLSIEKGKLDKIIYCLNIKDHAGTVYFPEVMWAIFYSIIGKNDKGLHGCKPMKAIMRRVKNKYPGLGRNTSLDMLCGNKFYRNEMTVTKYLCGKVILNNMRTLVEKNVERRKKEGTFKSMTVSKRAGMEEQRRQQNNLFYALYKAIVTTPEAFEEEAKTAQKTIHAHVLPPKIQENFEPMPGTQEIEMKENPTNTNPKRAEEKPEKVITAINDDGEDV